MKIVGGIAKVKFEIETKAEIEQMIKDGLIKYTGEIRNNEKVITITQKGQIAFDKAIKEKNKCQT